MANRVTEGWLTPASSATSPLDRYAARGPRSSRHWAIRRWVGVSRTPSKSASICSCTDRLYVSFHAEGNRYRVDMRLASIHTYPVKGLHRVDHDAARVRPWGLAGDRRLMLIDHDGRMVTQRDEPRLALFRPSYVDGELVVRATDQPELRITPQPGEPIEAQVWRDVVTTSLVGEAADAWFSEALDRKLRLVYLDDPTRRAIDPRYGRPDDRVSFADGYPLLLTNTASLNVLNDWIFESDRSGSRAAIRCC